MTVGARLVSYILPDEIIKDKPFFVSIRFEAIGDGEDFIFGGIADEDVRNERFPVYGWISDRRYKPGEFGGFRNNFPPLTEWYEDAFGRPIPDVLHWRVIVGTYMPEEKVVHLTDESPMKSIPVRAPLPPPPPPEEEGIWGWIKAHPAELAAISGGLMIGAAILTRK